MTGAQNQTVALIVAGGEGTRAGPGIAKQYRMLNGQPVLRRSVEAYLNHPGVHSVRAVIRPEHRDLYESAIHGLKLLPPAFAGPTRQASVHSGLEAWADERPAKVLIHDAARPLVSADVIARVIAALDQSPGAMAAIPVADTLKRPGADGILETVPRAGLWRAQTPQGFHFNAILAAHRAATGSELTDDAAIAERAGIPVAPILGSALNLKLTEPEDFAMAEQLLTPSPFGLRMGTGFDVHRFGPGDHVWLNGIRIAHDHGLIGHSDADPGLHALTDAILGALCDGDIGTHFPPTDERWRGVPSELFLKHAGSLVSARGGRILHADVTLICERPKVAPHRLEMQARIENILSLAAGTISVKATTTEGLGFTGRREGIAAQAAATLWLPPFE